MLAEDKKTIDASKTFSLITLDASRTLPGNLLEKGSSLEKTREKLAMRLICIFGGTVFGAFVFLVILGLGAVISSNNTNKDTATPAKEKITTLLAPAKEIFTILLTTQATLVGSAVGFYFGERSSMKR
jgi:hypothetical protein